MKQLAIALPRIVFLVAILAGAIIAEAQTHTTHSWSFMNIFAIKDTGSDFSHRIDGQQRCSVGGETRYASVYESHSNQLTWYSYNQYTSTQHEYKREYRCTTCGHVRVTSQFQPHQCESIWDTQCGQCGYTNVRMCG